MKAKRQLTHAEISQALNKFQKQGGLIKRLPAEIVLKGALVGGKWSMYETVIDPTAGGKAAAEDAPAGE
jgi:hypothetical protein